MLGLYQRFSWQSLPGNGWTGVVVAILARDHPLLLIPAALFLSYLQVGGDLVARNHDVPSEVVGLIQALILIFVTASVITAIPGCLPGLPGAGRRRRHERSVRSVQHHRLGARASSGHHAHPACGPWRPYFATRWRAQSRIEGMMLSAALAGVVVSAFTGSAWIGLLGALLIGLVLAGMLAIAVHALKADLILAGIALNMLAASGTTLILFMLTGDKGMSGSLASQVLPSVQLPFIADIPLLGTILSGHHILTYVAFLLVPVMALTMMRTPFGVRLRAVGENAEAAATAGINVVRMQVAALLLSGLLAGAAGAFLSMGYVSWFSANMSAGRGFVALAADLMGYGSAWGTMLASLLLGTADAVVIALQGRGLPSELLQAVPYIVPVIALVIHARRRHKVA